MKIKIIGLTIGIVIGLCGGFVIYYNSNAWLLVGIVLMIWGNNLERKYQK